VIKRKMKIKNKLVALVEIVIVLCPVFLMTLSVIAAEQKFHKHSSIFSALLLLLLNEWFERFLGIEKEDIYAYPLP